MSYFLLFSLYLSQTKYFSILVPVPLWHLICTNCLQWYTKKTLFWCYLGQICIRFVSNLASLLKKMMPKMLFGKNLVSNISTKASKSYTFKGAYWISSNSSFIQYCDSNIGLFSIAPPLVIALPTLQ